MKSLTIQQVKIQVHEVYLMRRLWPWMIRQVEVCMLHVCSSTMSCCTCISMNSFFICNLLNTTVKCTRKLFKQKYPARKVSPRCKSQKKGPVNIFGFLLFVCVLELLMLGDSYVMDIGLTTKRDNSGLVKPSIGMLYCKCC